MNSNYKPLIVAVFLVFAGLASFALLPGPANVTQVQGILGGVPIVPRLVSIAQGAESLNPTPATITQSPVVATDDAGIQSSDSVSPSDQGMTDSAAVIEDPGQPIGSPIIIPIAPNANSASASNQNTLPNYNGYFISPAQGSNSHVLDSNNGVQIVNSCGTPVVAAADGVVVPDPQNSDSLGGWNGGYGKFVLIEHPFGNEIFTRYAHLEQLSVQIGQYVKQGQQIGLIGQTGGATNCNLDFEVIGARNPFGN